MVVIQRQAVQSSYKFLYHGESYLSRNLDIFYVLHTPSSLVPNRYEFIVNKSHRLNNCDLSIISYVKEDFKYC